MKIVINGAAGFIGCRLSERYNSYGHDVVRLEYFTGYLDKNAQRRNVAHALQPPNSDFHPIDCGTEDFDEAFDGATSIFHQFARPAKGAFRRSEIALTSSEVRHLRLFDPALDGCRWTASSTLIQHGFNVGIPIAAISS